MARPGQWGQGLEEQVSYFIIYRDLIDGPIDIDAFARFLGENEFKVRAEVRAWATAHQLQGDIYELWDDLFASMHQQVQPTTAPGQTPLPPTQGQASGEVSPAPPVQSVQPIITETQLTSGPQAAGAGISPVESDHQAPLPAALQKTPQKKQASRGKKRRKSPSIHSSDKPVPKRVKFSLAKAPQVIKDFATRLQEEGIIEAGRYTAGAGKYLQFVYESKEFGRARQGVSAEEFLRNQPPSDRTSMIEEFKKGGKERARGVRSFYKFIDGDPGPLAPRGGAKSTTPQVVEEYRRSLISQGINGASDYVRIAAKFYSFVRQSDGFKAAQEDNPDIAVEDFLRNHVGRAEIMALINTFAQSNDVRYSTAARSFVGFLYGVETSPSTKTPALAHDMWQAGDITLRQRSAVNQFIWWLASKKEDPRRLPRQTLETRKEEFLSEKNYVPATRPSFSQAIDTMIARVNSNSGLSSQEGAPDLWLDQELTSYLDALASNWQTFPPGSDIGFETTTNTQQNPPPNQLRPPSPRPSDSSTSHHVKHRQSSPGGQTPPSPTQ
jgi:hypothetical protein